MDTTEVEMRVECECGGIYEDCTPAYIGSIKALYCGTWICGLCSEVVNEQMKREPSATIEEAVKSHMSVCSKFNMTIRLNPQLILADSLRDIARKSSKYRTTKDLSASRIARSISLKACSDVNMSIS